MPVGHDLPPEILLEIFSTIRTTHYTDWRSTLSNCALVCQRFRSIAQAHLFEDIGTLSYYFLRKDQESGPRTPQIQRMVKLTAALQTNPQLVRLIDAVSVSIDFFCYNREGQQPPFDADGQNSEPNQNKAPETTFTACIESICTIPHAHFSRLNISLSSSRTPVDTLGWSDFSPSLQGALERLVSASTGLKSLRVFQAPFLLSKLFPVMSVRRLEVLTVPVRPGATIVTQTPTLPTMENGPALMAPTADSNATEESVLRSPVVQGAQAPVVITDRLETSTYGAWLLDQRHPDDAIGWPILDVSSTRQVVITPLYGQWQSTSASAGSGVFQATNEEDMLNRLLCRMSNLTVMTVLASASRFFSILKTFDL